MHSIRQQISSRLLTGASVLLLIASFALGTAIHSRLVGELDHTLETKIRALAALTSREAGFIEFDFSPAQMPEFDHGANEPEYFELRLPDGRLLAKSPSLGENELPQAGSPEEESVYGDVILPGGDQGRIARLLIPIRVEELEIEPLENEEDNEDIVSIVEFDEEAPNALAITVARSRDDLDALLRGFYGTLCAIGLLLLGGLALLTRYVVQRGLQPIADINAQVGAIRPHALESRIGLAAPPEELSAIVTAINGLLARLQSAFAKERRFSSDVAHELRTPVAELRTACEVGAKWPENPHDTRQFFNDVRDIAAQMERVVSNLLTLARCDEGDIPIVIEAVDLDAFVRACAERAFAVTGDATTSIQYSGIAGAIIQTDRGKLQMVLQNLFDNAATYRAPNTPLRCHIDRRGAIVELRIENEVNSLAREDVAHMAERFWRKDRARTGGTHAGLGLSIAQALAEKLGLDLKLELRNANTFCARVAFGAGN